MPVTAGYVSNPYQAFGDPDIPSPYPTYSQYGAADYGYLAMSGPPEIGQGTILAPASGLIWATAIKPEVSGTVTKLLVSLISLASGNTGTNAIGLYNSSGVILSSATLDVFTTTGPFATTIPGVSVTVGAIYYVCFLGHYTSAPAYYGTPSTALNAMISAPFRSFQVAGSGYASLPGSFTPSAGSALNTLPFIAMAA